MPATFPSKEFPSQPQKQAPSVRDRWKDALSIWSIQGSVCLPMARAAGNTGPRRNPNPSAHVSEGKGAAHTGPRTGPTQTRGGGSAFLDRGPPGSAPGRLLTVTSASGRSDSGRHGGHARLGCRCAVPSHGGLRGRTVGVLVRSSAPSGAWGAHGRHPHTRQAGEWTSGSARLHSAHLRPREHGPIFQALETSES